MGEGHAWHSVSVVDRISASVSHKEAPTTRLGDGRAGPPAPRRVGGRAAAAPEQRQEAAKADGLTQPAEDGQGRFVHPIFFLLTVSEHADEERGQQRLRHQRGVRAAGERPEPEEQVVDDSEALEAEGRGVLLWREEEGSEEVE